MACPAAFRCSLTAGLAVLFFVQLAETGAQSQVFGAEVQELELVVQALRGENDQQKAALAKLQGSLVALQAENDWLRQQWEAAQVRMEVLGAGPANVEAQTAQRHLLAATRQLALVKAAQLQLIEQVGRLLAARNAEQDLGPEWAGLERSWQQFGRPVAASGSEAGELAASRIEDVNAPLGVVVLDVGAEDGARLGMPFVVWREDRQVARLRVIEIRPRVCAALVEWVEQSVRLRAGDGARVMQTTAAGQTASPARN